MSCPLCDRNVPLTRHHAKLARRDAKLILRVCRECQQTIHGIYPDTQLARRADLWTIEGLLADPPIAAALVFVRKLPPGDTMRMRERKR